MSTIIKLKRVYEAPSASDGYRILVDRLWPQGLTKAQVAYDLWAKDVAPSAELRQWFHEDRVGRWDEFVRRYRAELSDSDAFASLVQEVKAHPVVTLLYASKDTEHNQADVLYDMLKSRCSN